jgi:hypothetical protein
MKKARLYPSEQDAHTPSPNYSVFCYFKKKNNPFSHRIRTGDEGKF